MSRGNLFTWGRAPHDPWIPQISCQACGMSWPMKTEIHHDCTEGGSWSCPDCDYTTLFPDGGEKPCGGIGVEEWGERA